MNKTSSLIVGLLLLFCSYYVTGQNVDLTGIWEGKLLDRTINNNIKYDGYLELQKTGENEYFGFLKLERKLSILLKAQGNMGNPNMPKHNFIGTFFVRGISRNNSFTLSIVRKISNNDPKITWCEISPSFTVNESGDKMSGKYNGCALTFGTHVILQGGDIELKRESNALSPNFQEIYSSLFATDYEIGDNFVLSDEINSIEYSKIQLGKKNLMRISIKNKNKFAKTFTGNFKVTVPKDKKSNFELVKKDLYLGLNPEQELYFGTAFDIPLNTYADSVLVEITLVDKTTNNEDLKIIKKVPIETLFSNKFSVKTSPRTKFMNDFLSMNNSKANITYLESLIKNHDSLAYAWKGILLATGRGGYTINKIKGKEINKWTIKKYINELKSDDAEIAYLVGMSKILTNDDIYGGESILSFCANNKFIPAVLDYNTFKINSSSEKDQYLKDLTALYDQGIKRAALSLSESFHNKDEVSKQKITTWLNKVANTKDVDYVNAMAKFYVDYEGIEKGLPKAEELLKTAISYNNFNAIAYVGNLLTNATTESLIDKGLNYLKIAAEGGNIEAMYYYGVLLTSNKLNNNPANASNGLKWLNNASVNNHSKAMIALSSLYYSGIAGEKNYIKYRYWSSKAIAVGENIKKDGEYQEPFTFNKLFNNLDFSPRREVTVYNQYGSVIDNYKEGPDALELTIDALITTYVDSRKQKQEFINEVELISSTPQKTIYGGTVSSISETNLYVKAGELLEISAQGIINFGMMAGNRTPDGARNGLASTGLFQDLGKSSNDFRDYNIESNYPHGVFMIKIGNSGWFNVGLHSIIKVPFDGEITIAVNDSDATNNSGYYDFEVIVKKGY